MIETLDLPEPVAAYLAADQAKDPDLLATCFAADAWVHDEAHDYYGVDAIIDWKRDADTKYQYAVEPLATSVHESTFVLHARLTGTFPGSPVEVDYFFAIAGDKITELEIR